MSLQNLFEMVKADRYTADGCEALNKAREADVEDRRYKNGEISEKTGLMKTPKGWVEPPKGGRTPKSDVPGNKPLNNKYYKNDIRTEAGEKKILSETKTDVLESKVKDLEDLKKRNGGKLGTQGEKSLQLAKEELAKRGGSKSDSSLNKSWSQSDVINELPKGWKRVEGATTAPNGYVVVSNNQSRFGGDRETKLIKQEDYLNSVKQSESKNWNDFFSDMDKKVYGESKPDLREIPQHLEQAYPQNMTITKEDEERFGKAALSGLSGPRESSSERITEKRDAEVGLHEGEENLPDFVKGYKLLSEEHDQDAMESNAKLYPELQPLVKQRGPFVQKRIAAYTKLRDNPNNPKARADFVDASNAITQIDADIDRAYKKAIGDAAPRELTGDCKIRVRKS